jgi:hypothetical protein
MINRKALFACCPSSRQACSDAGLEPRSDENVMPEKQITFALAQYARMCIRPLVS